MAFSDGTSRFLRLLANIARYAKSEHVKTMKFIMKDKITKRELESCEDMMDIFEKMMNRVFISPEKENLSALKELIMGEIFHGDGEVKRMFDEYENIPPVVEPRVDEVDNTNRTDDCSSQHSGFTSLEDLGHADNQRVQKASTVSPRFTDAFTYASKHMGYDWKVFARLVGLGQSEIISIQEAHKGNAEQQSFETFCMWYKRQNFASMTEFRKVLRDIPRNDIADAIKKY